MAARADISLPLANPDFCISRSGYHELCEVSGDDPGEIWRRKTGSGKSLVQVFIEEHGDQCLAMINSIFAHLLHKPRGSLLEQITQATRYPTEYQLLIIGGVSSAVAGGHREAAGRLLDKHNWIPQVDRMGQSRLLRNFLPSRSVRMANSNFLPDGGDIPKIDWRS